MDLERLRTAVRSPLVLPGDPAYDEARTVWNAMIDRRPAVIVRCQESADVVEGLRFARAHALPVAVRGSGHNIAGHAVCDGGLVLDLSPMRAIHVDARQATARVEPGCTLGDVDIATQAFGLAVPTGINSTTGIAGLTLGGGYGWLSRPYGMTIDSLIGADVVTADGASIHASDEEHADLFWGLRGGGGNFGVVTSFEFRLHPVGPEVLAGLVVHPIEHAADVLREYRALAESLPDECTVSAILRAAPPLPSIPSEWHGRRVLMLASCYVGDVVEGERVLRPVRSIGHPIADTVAPRPYAEWQRVFDPAMVSGARNYWKSHDLAALDDGVVDAVVRRAADPPSPQCTIFLWQWGGAAARVAPDRTAYPHRTSAFKVVIQARWSEPAQDGACIAWARALFDELTPYSTGGVYVNFLSSDETDRVAAAYGGNFGRLARLKGRWDPENVFHANQNIRPADIPVHGAADG